MKRGNLLESLLFPAAIFHEMRRFFNFSLVGPHIFLSSNRLMAEEKQNVTIACNATVKLHPSITWSKAFSSLPKENAVVKNGALTIYNVVKNDGEIYM